MGTFSDDLWDASATIYERIRSHPFLAGLTDGTLGHDAFEHFVVQDAHYLRGYARALAVLAARAPTEHDTVLFAQHAAGAIAGGCLGEHFRQGLLEALYEKLCLEVHRIG